MRGAIVVPANLLERYGRYTDYHLVLAHLINQRGDYKNFWRQQAAAGNFIILDNSVIELGHPMPREDLTKAVNSLLPTELVLQDFPLDPQKTYKEAYEQGQYWKEKYPDMSLMVVPQWYGSKDLESWFDSLYDLALLEWVDTIGIPKFLKDKRPMAVSRLNLNRPDMQYHLLGTWGNPQAELAKYTHLTWLRGVDTKAPLRFSTRGVVLHPKAGLLGDFRYGLPALDMEAAPDPMPVISDHNIKAFLTWLESSQSGEVIDITAELKAKL